MNKKLIYTWLLLLMVATAGCKQASDLKAFTEAKYSLQQVQDVKLNEVDVMQKRKPNDFTTREGDSLLAAITRNTLRASSTLFLFVEMPEQDGRRSLEITNLEWQLLVDGEQTLQGAVTQPMQLHEGLNKLPIHTSVMMSESAEGRNYEGLSKLMTLLSRREDLRKSLTLQIKPTVQTPVGAVQVPQFITVSKPSAR